jgi:DNA-binding NarL/FixJ family response regulator
MSAAYPVAVPSKPPNEGAFRVLLADDHKLFAESLMTVLSEDERIDVIGIAANGEQVVELATQLQPDVILMDIKMPGIDGLEATRRIREKGIPTRILLLTGTDEPIGSKDATLAGANGFIRKERSVEELKEIMLEVASLATVFGTPRR